MAQDICQRRERYSVPKTLLVSILSLNTHSFNVLKIGWYISRNGKKSPVTNLLSELEHVIIDKTSTLIETI